MALKRKRTTSSRKIARKRTRYSPRSRIGKRVDMSTSLVRTTYIGATTFSSASTSGFWQYRIMSASQLPSFAELAAVFDEYKIGALKYTFRPRYDGYDANDPATSGSTSPLTMCTAHVINDPGSSMVPAGTYTSATLNTFLENGKVKSYPLTKPFSVYFRPKIATGALGGATGTICVASKWIKTLDDQVTHRGFHMFLQNNSMAATNGSVILDTFVTFYMKVRGAK